MNRRTAGLVVVALLLSAAPAWALKRFMLMGDSIQAGTGVTNASSLTANLLSMTANVVIENFSSPGARMTDVGFFPGMTHDGMCVQQVHGFFGMQGLIITHSEPATSVALHPNDLGHMLMAANLRSQLTAIGWLP